MTAPPPSGLDVPDDLVTLPHPLPGCARIIANGGTLTIVALGSSSTAGAYASSPSASYPARLGIELGLRFPDAGIKVLNRGENGEDAAENLARFDKSVGAEHPNLVIWQVGTNWLVQDRSLAAFKSLVVEGLTRSDPSRGGCSRRYAVFTCVARQAASSIVFGFSDDGGPAASRECLSPIFDHAILAHQFGN